jgi:hypothetical protein
MTSSSHPAADIATARRVLTTLPAALRAARATAGIGVRAAARDMGIAPSTLTRLEADHAASLTTLIAALTFIHAHSPD